MVQNTECEDAVAVVGPADAILFETLDVCLTNLNLYTGPEGVLLATTPGTSSVVQLTVSDRGLVATEIMAQDIDETDHTPVDQINPAPGSDIRSITVGCIRTGYAC